MAYIIVGAPDQDPLASVADLLFLARRPVLAGLSVFYPAPGSADYRHCCDRGLLPASFAAMRSTALPLDQRTSRTDSVTLLRLARVLNFIKALRGAGLPVPSPAPVAAWIDPALDRQTVGLKLLAAFLRDGIVRGVTTQGRVYPHPVSPALCGHFLDGLQAAPVLPS